MSEDEDKGTHLSWHREPHTGDLIFSGRVSMFDVARLRLDRVERAMLAEPIATAADFLLDAETIFRRMQEQTDKPRVKT